MKRKSTKTSPEIPIIFEDDHLLIIRKPVNLLSQKDHTGDPDVVSLCKQYLSQRKSSSSPYVGLLHRLDRPVGGIMLLAKSKRCARQMSGLMKEQRVDKTYWAVVTAHPPANGFYEHYLRKDSSRNLVKAFHKKTSGTKRAALTFQRLQHNEEHNISLISVHLLTGRSHQIRVQLATEDYPILYDHKYGNTSTQNNKNIALYSTAVRFTHPITHEELALRRLPESKDPWNLFSIDKLAEEHLSQYND